MEIILKKDVQGLGEEGDIVKVKNGYGRNYLIPYGFAVNKNKANLFRLEKERDNIEERKSQKRKASEALFTEINNITITLYEKAADNNKLFGSVSSQDIAKALEDKGYAVDRRQIELNKHIKVIGTYPINIKLHSGIVAKINVAVENEEKKESEVKEEVKEEAQPVMETPETTEPAPAVENEEEKPAVEEAAEESEE